MIYPITHKILVVVICEEVLQAAGPVSTALEEPVDVLWAAHEAVPGVFFDGGVSGPLTHEEIYALHTETPEHTRRGLDGFDFSNKVLFHR